jgi:hypothetical protein
VQGAGRSLKRQLQIALFGVAFTSGAVLTFAAAYLAGTTMLVGLLPRDWLLGVAGGCLVTLAVIDVLAIRRKTFCPLAWPRQTPKTVARTHGVTAVMAVWGFDTGLAVTTFRVAALTWGALVLAAAGLTVWWVGVGYGVAFVVPLLVLMLTQGQRPIQRLEAMILKRAWVQLTSSLLLLTAAGFLLASLLTSI